MVWGRWGGAAKAGLPGGPASLQHSLVWWSEGRLLCRTRHMQVRRRSKRAACHSGRHQCALLEPLCRRTSAADSAVGSALEPRMPGMSPHTTSLYLGRAQGGAAGANQGRFPCSFTAGTQLAQARRQQGILCSKQFPGMAVQQQPLLHTQTALLLQSSPSPVALQAGQGARCKLLVCAALARDQQQRHLQCRCSSSSSGSQSILSSQGNASKGGMQQTGVRV